MQRRPRMPPGPVWATLILASALSVELTPRVHYFPRLMRDALATGVSRETRWRHRVIILIPR